VFARGVAALAVAWLSLILAAPVLWIPLAGVVYLAGAAICHQLPDRSFHLHAAQLPVCARCLGLYVGAALGSVAAAATIAGRAPAARRTTWFATAAAAAPTAITLVLEWGTGWPVSNVARASAAVPLGCAVAFVVVSALPTLHYE
jgi:uncharacterized membrane protein